MQPKYKHKHWLKRQRTKNRRALYSFKTLILNTIELSNLIKMKPSLIDKTLTHLNYSAWAYNVLWVNVLWVKLLAFILILQFYAFGANAQETNIQETNIQESRAQEVSAQGNNAQDISAPPTDQGTPKRWFKVGGYVMLDYDQYGAFYNKDDSQSEDHLEIRRSKLGFKFTPAGPVSAELEFTYHNEYQQDEEYEVADAYINYKSSNDWNVRLGKMKEPFGLERQTGSTSITSIERSMVTTAFSPGRNLGAMLKLTQPHYSVAIGVFEEDEAQSPQAITSRMTYGFINPQQGHKHIGISLSFRDLKDQEFQIKERGESNSADNIIRSAKFDAQSQETIQLEAAWITRKIRLQSEFTLSSVKQTNDEEWLYSGFYIQGSYLVNKDDSIYRYKNSKIKPKIKKGTWELVARYSGLDLQDNDIGSEASIIMLGMHYYVNKQFKVMANILLPDISGNTVDDDQSGNGLSLRAQYVF